MSETTIWGIHAGKTGNADALFKQRGCVAIGWARMGDLAAIPGNREAFKKKYELAYPEAKPGAIPTASGVSFRFVHEMKPGDLVVYPSKMDKQVHIGRITGEYTHDPSQEASYPQRRAVAWLKSVPRTRFSQGALYEIGSALSMFQIKTYADEFRAVVEGKAVTAPVPVTDDHTIAAVADEIEENTRDFIIKRLSQETKGLPLESFIVHLMQCMGYHARLTRKNEPSVDVIAHKDRLGIEPPIIKIQVKSGEGTVQDRDVSALYGKLSAGEYGLFITLSTFSPACLNFEAGKPNLRLIDGDELVRLILDHYESFDSQHKGLLPLQRVYVPLPIETDG
ncbi:restriction endonuclease [Stenotrophomonas sp. JC08]|uniref:restriction endonuclease n=1 Tax=Stenotrophomonas sp. JC08 TaxID=3445779 RepID=UPI003FA24573